FLAIEVADGSRTRFSEQYYDPDTAFIAPNSITLDIGAGRFFTTERRRSAIFTTNLNTGARTRFVDNTLPTDNVQISLPIALARDNTAEHLFVLSQEFVRVPNTNTSNMVARLVEIDAETGAKNALFEFNPRIGWGDSPL